MSALADSAFDTFLTTAWRPDFDGSADDDAAGEPRDNTHYGVIRATWNTEVARGAPVSDANFDTAPKTDFATVLRMACWSAVKGDQLADAGLGGVAIVLANIAMASGSREAVLLLQRSVPGVSADGFFGPATFTMAVAFGHSPGADLIGKLTAADEKFLASLATAPEYLRGWTRRTEVFEAVARTFQQGHA